MNDTEPAVECRFREMMKKKSGEERMKMGFSMSSMARKQVAASVKMSNPDADSREIRRVIFLRFYGQEFFPEEQKKILKKIGAFS